MKAVISVCVYLSLVLITACKREPELPKYYALPDFTLTDQTDKTVKLADLTGHVWIADFIFTNCGGTCPVMTDKMRMLHDTLPAAVRMLSITVDPSRDTSKVLAQYAAEHGASRDRWLFLTGDKQALYDLCVKGFKLPLDDTGGTALEPIAHSTRFVLLDRDSQVRGYYSGTEEEDLKRLVEDAKKLL
jgi:cytochrome oxidase Cu insertion factor (SCO1/SenC/PrrC family)